MEKHANVKNNEENHLKEVEIDYDTGISVHKTYRDTSETSNTKNNEEILKSDSMVELNNQQNNILYQLTQVC